LSRSPTILRDTALIWTLRALAAASGAIVLLVAFFVTSESVPVLRDVGPLRFFSDPSWHPRAGALQGSFNLVPMVAGSLLATLGAMLLASPLGVASAVFCQFYASARLAAAYRQLIGLLAGIPSVVYGFWGLVVLVPLLRTLAPPGQSLLAGILILALMILPTVALIADGALANVPRAYLLGASALGLSRFSTVARVALPAARSGLITATILGAGRAIGETMAILMVCGNVVEVPDSVFDPVRTLTANIALEMAYAVGIHRSALFLTGLVLLLLVSALVAIASRLTRADAHA
jgi:phosphate transport system permease protein